MFGSSAGGGLLATAVSLCLMSHDRSPQGPWVVLSHTAQLETQVKHIMHHNALQSFVNHLLSSNAKLNGVAAAH